MDSAPHDAALVCSLLEELGQHTLALEQEPSGPEEPSISDNKTVSDGDNQCYETMGPTWQQRLLCSSR